jgi:hypothetical protein
LFSNSFDSSFYIAQVVAGFAVTPAVFCMKSAGKGVFAANERGYCKNPIF